MGAAFRLHKAAAAAQAAERPQRRPMAEINVTPFVDVMLVLLIIFMVAAPLMTVGVPVDLPKSEGAEIKADSEPLTVIVDPQGKVFIHDAEIPLTDLQIKLQAITEARKGMDELIYVRGDKAANYGEIMRVMGRIHSAGYNHITFVTEAEEKH